MREIREMKPEEREKRLKELRAELSRLRTTVRAGASIENPMRLRELRRTIARIMTATGEESG